MIYASESECASHYTTAPHKSNFKSNQTVQRHSDQTVFNNIDDDDDDDDDNNNNNNNENKIALIGLI